MHRRSTSLARAALAVVAVILLLGGFTTVAQAQRGPHGRVFIEHRVFIHTGFPWYYPYYYGPTYYDPVAYQQERGYHDGFHRGKDDARHGRANNPEGSKHFRNSDSQNYREAFLKGYTDGYADAVGTHRG